MPRALIVCMLQPASAGSVKLIWMHTYLYRCAETGRPIRQLQPATQSQDTHHLADRLSKSRVAASWPRPSNSSSLSLGQTPQQRSENGSCTACGRACARQPRRRAHREALLRSLTFSRAPWVAVQSICAAAQFATQMSKPRRTCARACMRECAQATHI